MLVDSLIASKLGEQDAPSAEPTQAPWQQVVLQLAVFANVWEIVQHTKGNPRDFADDGHASLSLVI